MRMPDAGAGAALACDCLETRRLPRLIEAAGVPARYRDCTIQGLHLHNVIGSPAGLILEKCDRLHVTGCTILDCDNAGLLVKDCQRSTILGNVIRDDRDAATSTPIKVEGGTANTIQN